MADSLKSRWLAYIPDKRTLVTVGYFALCLRELYMIEGHAQLLADSAFMTIVTLTFGSGGLGIVTTFLFGGTQAGTDVMTTQSKAVAGAVPQAPPVPDNGPTGPTGP